jgi:hypothetical protein
MLLSDLIMLDGANGQCQSMPVSAASIELVKLADQAVAACPLLSALRERGGEQFPGKRLILFRDDDKAVRSSTAKAKSFKFLS